MQIPVHVEVCPSDTVQDFRFFINSSVPCNLFISGGNTSGASHLRWDSEESTVFRSTRDTILQYGSTYCTYWYM